MKYLVIMTFWLAVAVLLVRIVLGADHSGRLGDILAQVRENAHRVHRLVGIVAVCIVILLLVRLLVQAVRLW